MVDKINTYCGGYQLLAKKNVSKKVFVELCDNLATEFNNYYKTKDYSFSPECISEGGIIFNNFNEHRNAYKSMRIFFYDTKSGYLPLYGFISTHEKEKWIDDDGILIEKNKKLQTTLKSFYNAPPWTNIELKIFLKCFENAGLFLSKKPNKKELKKLDRSMYYLDLFNL